MSGGLELSCATGMTLSGAGSHEIPGLELSVVSNDCATTDVTLSVVSNDCATTDVTLELSVVSNDCATTDVTLELSGAGLHELPDHTFEIRALRRLYANRNQIRAVPKAIRALTQLVELWLSNNM